ncbi:MAG: 50S ribosomal protein L1 [Candidatus Bostrichicola ureolyticus]|nr:MAG: 50S ribosomal protein L1 [Candidatus Bostrichicola ureolyticus]
MKITKNRKEVLKKIDNNKYYTIEEATVLIKDISFTKFDSSVDLAINLYIRKTNKIIRGIVTLPHGTGKNIRILALVTQDKLTEAKEANATYIGLDEYLDKIKNGWLDFDVIVTMPMIMTKLATLGKILGPRRLMPNIGTISMEPGKAIKEIKSGKIDFITDRYGIIHVSIGKISFSSKKIEENALELIKSLKHTMLKGTYVKSIYISSTMSPSIKINTNILDKKL